ncbi:MAG TPA: DNA recombination protein RmuC [Candidatus Omnitrophota bacterium]|nr:DNA recombination protein RmuC [Candidatus Omnitrophota bacterium]HPT07238.1 DNA recombination protein RmuC [Candidatus Omnitrophota bacterium]
MIILISIAFLAVAVILLVLVFKLSSQVNDRLNQMSQVLQDAHTTIGQNLGNASTLFGDVHEKLGRLEEGNRRIYEIGKDIASLQDLLRAPKFRGQMGESLLENLLAQVLPAGHFSTQYRFKNGDAVDAVVRLGERLVPIDAKFSLENFQKMITESDETLRNSFRRKFVQDVKNRIDEIASKYILPAENTYDFALMYVPAENVYYEVIIKEDLISYGVSKKVIPVSPNTLYAYLQVICLGLKGMKIEENAKIILKHLGMLGAEITKFREDFAVLGTHISNTSRKYDEAQKRLDRFSDRLTNIQDTKALEES